MRSQTLEKPQMRPIKVLGMSTVYLPLMERLLYPLSYNYERTGDDEIFLFSMIYSIMVIVVSLIVGISVRRLNKTALYDKTFILATGLGGTIGICLVSFLDFSNQPCMVLIGMGTLLVALCVPIHFLFWSSIIALRDDGNALTDLGLSFVIASLFSAIGTSLALDFVILASVFPAVSAVLGYIYLARTEAVPLVPSLPIPRKTGILYATVIMVVLCDIVNVYFNQSARLQAQYPYRELIFYCQALIYSIIVFLYMRRPHRKYVTLMSFGVVTTMFIGALFLAIFVSDELLNLGTIPLNCANTVLIVFGCLIIVRNANRKQENPTFVLAIYIALFVFLLRFMQAVIMYESSYIATLGQSVNSVYLIGAITLIAVILLFITLFRTIIGSAKRVNESESATPAIARAPEAPEPSDPATFPALPEEYQEDVWRRARYEAVLLTMKEAMGLSDREIDVARLALQRYSARKMAEILYISENTVNSHLKHIYAKTGVHSKQEFIDFVERDVSEV